MKTSGLFYFTDEPGFAGRESREWISHYLKTCRNSRGNMGCNRFLVKREGIGRYSVRLNQKGSPVAIIITRGLS